MFHRQDDHERSDRITNDAIRYGESEGADEEFASLIVYSVLEGHLREVAGNYPPAGHGYSRCGR